MSKVRKELIVVGEQPVTLFPWQRTEVVTVIEGESMTKQSFKDECDINNIMKRYEKDLLLEHVNRFQGRFGDFTGAVEYHEACNIVMRAEEMFMALPATVRARFENDPAAFLAFATDEKNKEELYNMGLAIRPKASDNPPPPAPPLAPPVKSEDK